MYPACFQIHTRYTPRYTRLHGIEGELGGTPTTVYGRVGKSKEAGGHEEGRRGQPEPDARVAGARTSGPSRVGERRGQRHGDEASGIGERAERGRRVLRLMA